MMMLELSADSYFAVRTLGLHRWVGGVIVHIKPWHYIDGWGVTVHIKTLALLDGWGVTVHIKPWHYIEREAESVICAWPTATVTGLHQGQICVCECVRERESMREGVRLA